ncbi:MAG: rod shape-determining protein MreD [Bacteroides sp.]|nr:rod shape-determining protein MreD [Bacteroides sp.]
MVINYLHKIGWFIGLVLLQVLILNNVHMAGYATPFLYIYLILKFESDVSRNALMLWAFFLGLTVDIFSDTPGMNAAAIVLLAFVRPTFLRLFTPRDTPDMLAPAARTIGFSSFLKYLIICVLVHHGILLTIEFFSFANIGVLLLRIVASSLLTVVCIMAIEGIRKKQPPL